MLKKDLFKQVSVHGIYPDNDFDGSISRLLGLYLFIKLKGQLDKNSDLKQDSDLGEIIDTCIALRIKRIDDSQNIDNDRADLSERSVDYVKDKLINLGKNDAELRPIVMDIYSRWDDYVMDAESKLVLLEHDSDDFTLDQDTVMSNILQSRLDVQYEMELRSILDPNLDEGKRGKFWDFPVDSIIKEAKDKSFVQYAWSTASIANHDNPSDLPNTWKIELDLLEKFVENKFDIIIDEHSLRFHAYSYLKYFHTKGEDNLIAKLREDVNDFLKASSSHDSFHRFCGIENEKTDLSLRQFCMFIDKVKEIKGRNPNTLIEVIPMLSQPDRSQRKTCYVASVPEPNTYTIHHNTEFKPEEFQSFKIKHSITKAVHKIHFDVANDRGRFGDYLSVATKREPDDALSDFYETAFTTLVVSFGNNHPNIFLTTIEVHNKPQEDEDFLIGIYDNVLDPKKILV